MYPDPLAQIITPRAYHRKNPRWYHTHIIDWMMANPNGKLSDCAVFVGKTQATLSAIIRSDLFQAALEKRKQEFSAQQDLIIKQKLTQVSVASLDTILDVIDKKRSSIPLETLNSVADSALKRLGYGLEQKQQPAVQVNVQQNNVAVPISSAELDQARILLRQNQQRLATGLSPSLSDQLSPPLAGSATLSERPLGGAGNRLGGADTQLDLTASEINPNPDTRPEAEAAESPAPEQRKEGE